MLSEAKDVLGPWPWERITPERTAEVAKREPIQSGKLDPWFLDNGPLTPCGIGIELPTVFGPDDNLDPVGTDIYTTKVVKYPWAPDTYLAFSAVYFHYDGEGPAERQTLGEQKRGRGSGVTEVQVAASRDGLTWKRYPRPAYVPTGGYGSNDVHMYFLTHGMVRRGNEIWQYVGGHDGNGIAYHSAITTKGPWPLIRLVCGKRVRNLRSSRGIKTSESAPMYPMSSRPTSPRAARRAVSIACPVSLISRRASSRNAVPAAVSCTRCRVRVNSGTFNSDSRS